MQKQFSYFRVFTLFLFVKLLFPNNILSKQFEWVESAGGASYEHAQGIAWTKDEKLYVSGTFEKSFYWGTDTMKSLGRSDVFISQFDTSGQKLWTNMVSGPAADYCTGLIADKKGGAIMTGMFDKWLLFDKQLLRSKGMVDAFAARYNSDGKLDWIWSAGGDGYDVAYDIAECPDGNFIIAGIYADTMICGKDTLISDAKRSLFIAKVDSNGKTLWARGSGGEAMAFIHAVAVDGLGNIYLTGAYSGYMTWGASNFKGGGGFVIALDSKGEFKWRRVLGVGGESSEVTDLVVGNENRVYLTGFYSGKGVFGADTLKSKGEMDIFIASISNEGEILWARSSGGSGSDKGMGVCLSDDNQLFMTGWFEDEASFSDTFFHARGGYDFFVSSYSLEGELNKTWVPMGKGQAHGKALCAGSEGRIYAAGWFSYVLNFDVKLLISKGEADIWIGRLKY